MGATSVTGVGYGSVQGHNRGAKLQTLGVDHLLGPRVIAAGTTTLSGGTSTVILPLMKNTTAGAHMVLATAQAAAGHAVGATLTFDTNDTKIILTGTSTDVVGWSIVKIGLSGLNPAYPLVV